MNKPIQRALQLYKKHNGDFAAALQWHLANGVVVSDVDCFLLGYYCDRNDTETPLPREQADCFFAGMCVGDMRKAGMQVQESVPFLAYQRQFKKDNRVRVVDFKQFYSKI